MGTIKAVMFSALPPVRRPVPLCTRRTNGHLSLTRFFDGRTITPYSSGTAALARALALSAARASVANPEVIIPAYGCPDLIASCIHAGVSPRLVDTAEVTWSYDPDALSHSLNSRTVAIVAVNLLGIGDGSPYLSDVCRRTGISLIQDSAQFLPRIATEWPGEYVILSFGRGKPMNMLYGGALIGPSFAPPDCTQEVTKHRIRDRLLGTSVAAIAFNFLTSPHQYWAFSALPGTGLGKVAYTPLSNASPLPPKELQRLDAAFQCYCDTQSYRRDIWAPALDEWASFGILPLKGADCVTQMEPLRLALLAPDENTRNVIVEALNTAHLGASRFYGCDLPHVPGIPEAVRRQGPFPNATSLARRLFTLPTHALVTTETVKTACIKLVALHSNGDI
jgi:dTDP-4-amino-4,6-dideoxygalactose transaminase